MRTILPAGSVLRPIQPADLPVVHALQRRAETHDRIPIATPLEEFQEWLDDTHLDLAGDSRLVECAGRAVGWGKIWHRPSGVREERAYVLGSVDPDHRGRGIGTSVLSWSIERATQILRQSDADLPRYVRTRAYEFQGGAIRLYQRHGLAPVRYDDELLRDLDDLPPPPPLDGIEIVPWNPARSEEARVAQNDAFADHWGSTPRDPASWKHLMTSFGNRLDLSFHALDGETIVGVCRNCHYPADQTVTGRRDGWIGQIGVVRPHRKRGIATALIVASLRAFRNSGFTHSALGVDSENPTGAYRLYERLGFRRMSRAVIHQKQV